MAIRFVLDPELTEQLRATIVALWHEVTNAGGAGDDRDDVHMWLALA